MSASAIAETSFALSTQRLLFAGRQILFRTNDPGIARYAGEIFSEIQDSELSSQSAHAAVTIHVQETDEPCDNAPRFRARGHFAVARFTRADWFWFNLRTREVHGTCSPELAADGRRWRAHIFPALLGILSAVMDVAPVHAACLAREGRGILLAGHSGAGKSTLTVAMARRGHALLSDDWTYLASAESGVNKSGIEAWTLPVPVKLLPDADAFFPELLAYCPEVSLNGEIAYEVCPEECFGVSRILHCPVTAIVLLERVKTPGCSMIPISPEEAIRHLQAEVEPLEGSLASCYEKQIDLIRRLQNASCYRILFNDHPDKAAEALDIALSRLS